MRSRMAFLVVMILLLSLSLTGCAGNSDNAALQAELQAKEAEVTALQAEKEALTQEAAALKHPPSAITTALRIAQLLKAKDLDNLADYVHPQKGVRFSAYSHVDPESDRVLTAQQIRTALQDTQTYTWGSYDGSGDPISLTFSGYYDRFVYDRDFANPKQVGNGVILGTGNTLVNIKEVYPAATMIELYFPGFDPQYGGMDWRSLRLILEESNGVWYLVGVAHDEWTI